MKKALEFVRENISKTEYFLFDFFDTLVHLNYSDDFLKRLSSYHISRMINETVDCKTLYDIRRRAEITLYSSIKPYGEFTTKMLFSEMYKYIISLKEFKGISFDEKEFIDICQKIEIDNLKDRIYKDAEAVEILEYIKSEGKKVVVISDTTLLKTDILMLAETVDLVDYLDFVFVSSECGCNKFKGAIYDYVTEEIGVNKQECVMIGDNYINDYRVPVIKGIRAFCTEYKKDAETLDENTVKREFLDIASKNMKTKNEYSNFAFSLLMFCEKLYDRLQEMEYKTVYFFSREGEMLKKLFDSYIDAFSLEKIDSKYLYVSRKSTFVPSLKALDEEQFDIIFREFNSISTEDFVKNIGLEADSIKKLQETLNFPVDKTIIDFKNSKEFQQLKNNACFSEMYDCKRNEQAQLFSEYLKAEEVTKESERIAIVDVGWKGTIQDNIFKFFDCKVQIDGFYLGLNTPGNANLLNRKYGLVFDMMKENAYSEYLSLAYSDFERILFASHPSTDGYFEDDGVKPKMKVFDSENTMYETILPVQDGIFDCFNKLCQLFKRYNLSVSLYISEFVRIHLTMMLKKSKETMVMMKNLTNGQFENFGVNKSNEAVEKERFRLVNLWDKRFRIFEAVKNFGLSKESLTICHVLQSKGLFDVAHILNLVILKRKLKQLNKKG